MLGTRQRRPLERVTVFCDLADAGLKIDWRRSFITTDVNPFYDSFIHKVTPLSLSSSRKRIKKISFICKGNLMSQASTSICPSFLRHIIGINV